MKIEKVIFEELELYIHKKLLEKYKGLLASLNLAIYSMMKLFKGIILSMHEIEQLISENKIGVLLTQNGTALTSNYFREDILLDYFYVDNFIINVPAYLDNFVIYFHQLYHIETGVKATDKKVKKAIQEVEKIIPLIVNTLNGDLKEQFEKVGHILLHISNLVKDVRLKVHFLLKELNYVSSNTGFDEYMKAFNEGFKAIHKDGRKNEKGDLVKKMISLMKESGMNQIQLETLLEIPIKVANTIQKSYNHPKFMINVEGMAQATFFKWIKTMGHPSFTKTTLMENIDLVEFLQVINILYKQTAIVETVKESNPIMGPFGGYQFQTSEFSKIYYSWKLNMIEISDIEKNPQYLEELELMKNFYFFDPSSNSIAELGKFTKKLWEYQRKIVIYHSFIQNFSQFRKEVQEFAIKNFQIVIEVLLKPQEVAIKSEQG